MIYRNNAQKEIVYINELRMGINRLIYIACFVWLCYLDQIIGSATGTVQYAMKNYTGIVIGIIILTAYRIKDFLKIPYYLWIAIFFVGRIFALGWARQNVSNLGEFEASIWNVGLYGIIVIRMLYGWIVEKKRICIRWRLFGIWIVCMLLMIIAGKGVAWPKWFLLMWGCFYLTGFTKREINNLFTGMTEGIIVGFLLIQGNACLHRPFDMLRYEGMYSNSNINALFYLVVYGATLVKWYQMKLMNRSKIRKLPIILLVGVLFSLTFFTMGRTTLLMCVLLTMIFLLFQILSQNRNKLKAFVVDCCVIMSAIVLMFVPTYLIVRYVPALVDDPIYFEADVIKMDNKVQKGEGINSSKYISLEDTLQGAFGRMLWFLDKSEDDEIAAIDKIFPVLKVSAAQEDDWDESMWDWSEFDEVYVEPGSDRWHPIMSEEEFQKSPVKVRASIYKYYIEHMKWIGKRTGVDNVWISPNYSAPHAHNIFLFIAGEFGAIVGILFAVIIVIVYHMAAMGMLEKRSAARYYRLFVVGIFTTITIGFGMLEMCWVYGQIPFTLLFFVQYLVYQKDI